MPAEGMRWLERSELLSFEELTRLVGVLVEMGVHDVRLTGGEPLIRRELPRLVSMLAAIPGLRELALTTNGYQLERDAEALVSAGVTRFNVSVDSLQRSASARSRAATHSPRSCAAWRRSPRSRRLTRSRSTPSRCGASPRPR